MMVGKLLLLSLLYVSAQAIHSNSEQGPIEGLAAEECFGADAAQPACALTLLQTSATISKRSSHRQAVSTHSETDGDGVQRSAMPLPDTLMLHNHTNFIKLPGILTPDTTQEVPPWAVVSGGRKGIITPDSPEDDLPFALATGRKDSDAPVVVAANHTDLVKLPGILTPNTTEEVPPWAVVSGGRKGIITPESPEGDLPWALATGRKDAEEGLSLFQATALMHQLAKERNSVSAPEIANAEPEIDEEDLAPVTLLQTGLQLKAGSAKHTEQPNRDAENSDVLGVLEL